MGGRLNKPARRGSSDVSRPYEYGSGYGFSGLTNPRHPVGADTSSDGFFASATLQSATTLPRAPGKHRLTPMAKEGMKNLQSLNFSLIDSLLYRDYLRKTTTLSHVKHTFGKWFICFLIGVLVGLVAWGIKMSVEHTQDLKFKFTANKVQEGRIAIAFLIYASANTIFVMLACVLVIFSGPLSSSSGIPEVMGYLNGVKIPSAMSFKTLVGKVLSLVLAYSSGLAIGPEGPMIHIGSAVGAAVGHLRKATNFFWKYNNDRDKRDFISTGAATGMAAAFGAPIGGVLFSIEEASSFWSRQLTWRTFFCCMIATFTVNFLLQGFGTVDIHDSGLLTFGLSRAYLYRYVELLCFFLLGILGGGLGAVFVYFNVRLNKWRKNTLGSLRGGRSDLAKFAEILLIGLATSSIVFFLSFKFPCRQVSSIIPEPAVCEEDAAVGMVQFFCKPGFYNEMASLLFTNPDAAMRRLFDRSHNMFTLVGLSVFTTVYFILSLVTAGTAVAGGLFIPMMMVGAGMGRLMGELMLLISPETDPSIYALIGASSMMAGYSRLTISLVVIMVELTEGTQYLLPIIMAVMVAKWTADLFTESLYDNLMHLKCIPFLHSKPPRDMQALEVGDVMAEPVVSLREVERVGDVLAMLRSNNHNGFPVVSGFDGFGHGRFPPGSGSINGQRYFPSATALSSIDHADIQRDTSSSSSSNNNSAAEMEAPQYKGMILRVQLLILLQYRVFHSGYQSIRRDFDFDKFSSAMASPPPLAEHLETQLTEQDKDSFLDLRPHVNSSAVAIHNSFSFGEAYRLFRSLGLRHLPVINVNNEVVGMVTRKDLL
eukprot:TRINITY_DN5794_c0_g1_i4.p1 TRINITY_DN5794_c0_g1~~TRINITY_DN5794_c0_g1_i4.p1  ORF type:complete len:822 (-),score=207.35 TRINITY_DN5794_c0_g1_i4:223-2688(-)